MSMLLHMSVITQGGQSALMFATKDGRTKVVSQLIEGGANTDLRNMVNIL